MLDKLAMSHDNSRILVAETESAFPHFDTGLDIALHLSSLGHKVTFLYLGNSLYPLGASWASYRSWIRNESRPGGWPATPAARTQRPGWLIRRARQVARLKRFDLEILEAPKFSGPTPTSEVPDFCDLSQLSNWAVDDFPVGRYIASAAISQLRDPQFSPAEVRGFIQQLYGVFEAARFQTEQVLSQEPYGKVCIYNGQFPESGGILCALRQFGCQVFYHETLGEKDSYFFMPFRPHDSKLLGAEYRRSFESFGESFPSDTAISGGERDNFQAIRQKSRVRSKDYLPSRLQRLRDTTSPTVVFFTSSEDEFESIDSVHFKSDFANQSEAIAAFAEACSSLGFNFIVRVHPNISSKHPSEIERWNKDLASEIAHEHWIRSDEKCPASELIELCQVVVTYGSTLTVDAISRSRPVVSCLETIYEYSGADVLRVRNRRVSEVLTEALNYPVNSKSGLAYRMGPRLVGQEFSFIKASGPVSTKGLLPRAFEVEVFLVRLARSFVMFLKFPFGVNPRG